MNFMFHTMLDAAGIVLRVLSSYQSMKCDILFSQGSVRTLFRRGGNFCIHEQQNFFLFTTVQKLYKSTEIFQSYDHKCTATFFYGSQCIIKHIRSLRWIQKKTNCNNKSNGDDSGTGHDTSAVWKQHNKRRQQRLRKHVTLCPQSLWYIPTSATASIHTTVDRRISHPAEETN